MVHVVNEPLPELLRNVEVGGEAFDELELRGVSTVGACGAARPWSMLVQYLGILHGQYFSVLLVVHLFNTT
jgi:hypothetical protein